MEKNRISGFRFRCHRLLTACVLFAIFVPSLCFGIVSFATLLRSLKIVPEQSFCFVGDTCNFVLEIPEYLPSRIDVTLQSAPDGVALLSLTKDGYSKDGVEGTRIVLTFKFSKKGTYKIPSLTTLVDWRFYSIPFQSITVYEDPRTLLPEVSVSVPKSVNALEPFTAKVSARFFSEILEVYSDLEENAIITRSENTIPLPFERKEFTEDYAEVALYDLIPIEQGTLNVPSFHVLAKTYAGGQVLLSSEPVSVKVLSPKKTASSGEGAGYYASVLDSVDENEAETPEDTEPSVSDGDEGAFEDTELSFPEETAIHIMKVRKIQKILSYVFLALSILGFSSVIFFIVRRNKKFAKIMLMLFILLLAACIVMFILSSFEKGVAACNTTIYSIPELKSSSASTVSAGEVMSVKSVINDWYSVKLVNGSEGWIKSVDCIYCGD